jgi:CheY-like chemotaxis protein
VKTMQTVWVVDDEPLIRTAIVAVLEERGFQ